MTERSREYEKRAERERDQKHEQAVSDDFYNNQGNTGRAQQSSDTPGDDATDMEQAKARRQAQQYGYENMEGIQNLEGTGTPGMPDPNAAQDDDDNTQGKDLYAVAGTSLTGREAATSNVEPDLDQPADQLGKGAYQYGYGDFSERAADRDRYGTKGSQDQHGYQK